MDDQTAEKTADGCKDWKKDACGRSTCGGTYGLAFIGALVYFIGQADTFWQGVLGVLKAVVWPALVAYKLLVFLAV